jgi:predicted nucleic acid-binding protein
MTYVLDACALIAFLKKEDGKEKIRDILQEAENETASVYMCIANLIEVNYRFIRILGKEGAAVILNQIYDLPIQIIDPINKQVFDEASRLKAAYAISLADAIGLGTAINQGGIFVTADGEMKPVEAAAEKINFFWFRPPKEKK